MTDEANRFMAEYAKRVVRAAAEMHGCSCDIRLMGAAMNSLNDVGLSERLVRVCEEKLHLRVERPEKGGAGGSEDYSYFCERVQGHGGESCYFMNFSRCASGIHTDQFDFQEEALTNGVKAFCGIVADLLM